MNQKNCAYSIKTSRVKEPDFPYHGQSITCTSELVEFAKILQSADIEKDADDLYGCTESRDLHSNDDRDRQLCRGVSS